LIKCDAKDDVETNSNTRKEIENSKVKEGQKLLMCPDEYSGNELKIHQDLLTARLLPGVGLTITALD